MTMVQNNSVACMQAHSFELQDPIRGEVAYIRGGLVTQVKEPKQLSFRSLADVCTSYLLLSAVLTTEQHHQSLL